MRISISPKEKYIWLCGENLGKTANNNSYYFWDHLAERSVANHRIAIYFILERSSENERLVASLPRSRRRMVVWRNSPTHYYLYSIADMLIATFSYRDVVPDVRGKKDKAMLTRAPLVYLQHGTLGMKMIGYNERSYNGNLFKFLYYNQTIKESLIERCGFRDYQCFNGIFHPRYKELARLALDDPRSKEVRSILWFITWREFGGREQEHLNSTIQRVIQSEKLISYLTRNRISLNIVCHQLMNDDFSNLVNDGIRCENIKIYSFAECDVMKALVSADLLITDYSSVAFDFTFLGKPVILYQPDLEFYHARRNFFCSLETLQQMNVEEPDELVEAIVCENYSVNTFFKDSLPADIDLEKVASGIYIDRIFDYLAESQKNKVTFLGYGFWGKGGTVTATKALGEALLRKGFMVQLASLKAPERKSPAATGNAAGAIQFSAFYYPKSKSKIEKAKRWLFRSKRFFSSIKHDGNLNFLIPYSGYALSRYISNSNDGVIVSTRESFHEELANSASSAKKVFFFHCQAGALEEYFPGIVGGLSGLEMEKTLFTTEVNYDEARSLGISPQTHLSIGNCLEFRMTRNRLEMFDVWINRKSRSEAYRKSLVEGSCSDAICCVTLLRLSKTRIEAIDRVISFGKAIKSQGVADVKVFVYGNGDAVSYLNDHIRENDLLEIIYYLGETDNPSSTVQKYDCLIDFSLVQSFGMPYLESIFNGVIPLCTRNNGSLEIFKSSNELFYSSWDELIERIRWTQTVSFGHFLKIYDELSSRYSQESVANRFVEYVFDGSVSFEKYGFSYNERSLERRILVLKYDDADLLCKDVMFLVINSDGNNINCTVKEVENYPSLPICCHYGGLKLLAVECDRLFGVKIDSHIHISSDDQMKDLREFIRNNSIVSNC